MDAEVAENFLHVAVDRVFGDAEVDGDLLAGPAFAEEIEDGAVAGLEAGDVPAGLIREGIEMEPGHFAKDDVDDAGFPGVKLWRTHGTIHCHSGNAARAHRPLGEDECADACFRPGLAEG